MNVKSWRAVVASVLLALVLVAPAAAQERYSQRVQVLQSTAVTGAGTFTSNPFRVQRGLKYLAVQASFTYGSGGTTTKVYLQTTLDGGTTWRDVASFAFALASAKKFSAVSGFVALAAAQGVSDGALADDTILNGLFGDEWRIKWVVVGTYATTTLQVDAVAQP